MTKQEQRTAIRPLRNSLSYSRVTEEMIDNLIGISLPGRVISPGVQGVNPELINVEEGQILSQRQIQILKNRINDDKVIIEVPEQDVFSAEGKLKRKGIRKVLEDLRNFRDEKEVKVGLRNQVVVESLKEAFVQISRGYRLAPRLVTSLDDIVEKDMQEFVNDLFISKNLSTCLTRDSNTFNHSLDVYTLALFFGEYLIKELGIEYYDLRTLAKAALYHDIGKGRVDPQILNKSGPLNEREIVLMQKHPQYGADILTATGNFSQEIIETVRFHHQTPDHTGYPQVSDGTFIPIHVQVVQVCDEYAALRAQRPYKEPYSFEKSLAMMQRDANAGKISQEVLGQFFEFLSLQTDESFERV